MPLAGDSGIAEYVDPIDQDIDNIKRQLRTMTTCRDECVRQLRRLESERDHVRRINEMHISKLEEENKTLKRELEAAKRWQEAYNKGQKRRVVSRG